MLMCQVSNDGLLRLANRCALDAALGIVSSIGQRKFAQLALEQINHLAPVQWWTVYRLHENARPEWHLGASLAENDVIPKAWACYSGGLWKHDKTFSRARESTRINDAVLTHLHAREVEGSHRQEIYSAFGLSERVSLVRRDGDGSVLCINFYRSEEMPAFRADELDDVACIGDLVMRAIESHLRCPLAMSKSPLDGLPRREREVCGGLLRGLTYDGIGVDLGLSVNTVKTYRDRAFDRLEIHHRSELFALMLKSMSQTVASQTS